MSPKEMAGSRSHSEGKSITELEIVYGVLQNPQMRRHAFFYFRDPDDLLAVPEAIRSTVYCETEPELIAKLHDLKEQIRRSDFPLLDGYPARWDVTALRTSCGFTKRWQSNAKGNRIWKACNQHGPDAQKSSSLRPALI